LLISYCNLIQNLLLDHVLIGETNAGVAKNGAVHSAVISSVDSEQFVGPGKCAIVIRSHRVCEAERSKPTEVKLNSVFKLLNQIVIVEQRQRKRRDVSTVRGLCNCRTRCQNRI